MESIDRPLFLSIEGVPQLKMERPPRNLVVKLEGKEEQSIILEGLFLSDTVAYFIEKL